MRRPPASNLLSILRGVASPVAKALVIEREVKTFDNWASVVSQIAYFNQEQNGYSLDTADSNIEYVLNSAKNHINDLRAIGDGIEGMSRQQRRAIKALYRHYIKDVSENVNQWASAHRTVVLGRCDVVNNAESIALDELGDLL